MPLEDQVTRETLKLFADDLDNTNSPQSIIDTIGFLFQALNKLEPAYWERFEQLAFFARRSVKGLKGRKPKLPLNLTSDQVFECAVQIMNAARTKLENVDKVRRDRRPGYLRMANGEYCVGLMLAFLAYVPLRLKNMAELIIEDSFRRDSHGYHVHFLATQMKSRRPFTMDVPHELDEYLDFYLDVVRPALAPKCEKAYLWISSRGTNREAITIHQNITGVTKARLKIRLTVHQLRHLLVDTIRYDDENATSALGHSSRIVTDQYYGTAPLVVGRAAVLDLF